MCMVLGVAASVPVFAGTVSDRKGLGATALFGATSATKSIVRSRPLWVRDEAPHATGHQGRVSAGKLVWQVDLGRRNEPCTGLLP
jgi:hypothetical protein